MNKETKQLIDYIEQSGFYLDKINKLKTKHNNIKDFQFHLSYVIMDIVSSEKKFYNMSRKNIELDNIALILF